MPATGSTWVARIVTSAGPVTKIISSATDSNEKAVCSSDESPSRALHRERTTDPSDGRADMNIAPVTNSVHSGARSWAQATNATAPAPNATVSGRSTRPWPKRSMSLPSCGVTNA